MSAHRMANRGELQATLSHPRAVVYITVEWAVQERHSRKTFAEFVERIEGGRPDLGVCFSILGEECEGGGEWFRRLRLPGVAGTGYGAVVWLDCGEAKDVVVYAAA